jgi:hypothetical protein
MQNIRIEEKPGNRVAEEVRDDFSAPSVSVGMASSQRIAHAFIALELNTSTRGLLYSMAGANGSSHSSAPHSCARQACYAKSAAVIHNKGQLTDQHILSLLVAWLLRMD